MNKDSEVNVAFVRPELEKMFETYDEISDFISGEKAVKSKGSYYLPILNPTDVSMENVKRNEDYRSRAYLFNASRKTLKALVGLSLIRSPIINLPLELSNMILDASGTGITLEQLAKKAVSYNVAYSRGGVFVDFTNEDEITVEDITEGRVRPTIQVFHPAAIRNWRERQIKGVSKLSLVVIYSPSMVSDGFEIKTVPKFIVLRLDENDEYTKEEWSPKDDADYEYSLFSVPDSDDFKVSKVSRPVDGEGNPLNEIPFMFFGSENNDADVDIPDFYDLVSLNISHYKDSADYQESCHRIGQPTPVVSGVDEHWVKDVMGGTIAYGSATGIPLPAEGKAYFIQPKEHNMVRQAMKDKEEMMQKIGARFTEIKSVQKTATEVDNDDKKESSTLTTIVDNISECFNWACRVSAKFLVPSKIESVEFRLNTDFDVSLASPDHIRAVSELYEKGQVSWGEFRNVLTKSGIATLSPELAKEEIKSNMDFLELFAKKEDQTEKPVESESEIGDN